MYCVKCGVELADSQRVCPLCVQWPLSAVGRRRQMQVRTPGGKRKLSRQAVLASVPRFC